MRKLFITAAILAAVAALPTFAYAQANTATGVVVGAGTGAIIAGPPGAIVGGIIGGTVGAANEPRVVEERVYVSPYAESERVCWRDDWGRRFCRYYRYD